MKVNENYRENLSMLEELCNEGEKPYWGLFSKACITLEESDFDLAISLCNQYKKKNVAQEYEVMKEEYFADFLQEVDPPYWRKFGDSLGHRIGYRKRNRWDIWREVEKQFNPKDDMQQALFDNLEDSVVDPFRDYCYAIYRLNFHTKSCSAVIKNTEDLRKNIFGDENNVVELLQTSLRSKEEN